jgi:aminopeptidase
MRTEELIKYAEMIVRQGVNIQPGQKMLVRAPIDAAPLVHKVVEVGYQTGASHVMVDWSDEELQRIRYDLEPEESLSLIHEGRIRDLKQMLDDGAAAVSIVAPRPEVMRGVNTERAGTFIKANNVAMRPFNHLIQSSHNSWTIAVYPTPEWARVMFPDLTQEEANAKLWESIKVVTRMDQADPLHIFRY